MSAAGDTPAEKPDEGEKLNESEKEKPEPPMPDHPEVNVEAEVCYLKALD